MSKASVAMTANVQKWMTDALEVMLGRRLCNKTWVHVRPSWFSDDELCITFHRLERNWKYTCSVWEEVSISELCDDPAMVCAQIARRLLNFTETHGG